MADIPATESPPTYSNLLRAHGLMALAMVGYTALAGLLVALKFHWPDFLSQEPWLTWGRLRYSHTQGVFFGWLGNAFLAFLYHAVPRLAGRPLTSRTLGWVLFFVWNFFLVLPGWALVQAGYSQPLEWAEFPLPIDAVAVVAFLLTCFQFAWPLLRGRLSDLYVSGWYILGALIFTLLAYPVGNVVPEFVPGARGAAYSGLWIHDAIGLYVTPLAVAIAYMVIPAATGRPIYSHFLSMVGFWLLFLVYPLNGTHHYVFSSIPMEAQKGAIIASVYLGVDVILVVANLLLSLKGGAREVASQVPLRFAWLGIVCYLIVSLQGSLQALMPVNRFIHFTDWVIGHAHLALIGFASFLALAGLFHAWERTPGFRYNLRAAEWSFWLLSLGLAVMFVDLTAAGLVQGQLWQSDAPWIDSVSASGVFWGVRSLAGVVVLLGFGAAGLAMTTGPVGRVVPREISASAVREDVLDAGASQAHGVAWLHHAYVLAGVAGVGFFALSFFVLAVIPGMALNSEIAATRPGFSLPPLTPAEERGRHIYGREGCAYCHTQLVRFTAEDVRRFGPASRAWESEGDRPQLWGTRRIGPDLAREQGKRSRDWHLAHLWNPHHVVPGSNMPGYPWLFDGSARRPGHEAADLIAYLESLGRGAQLAGLTGPASLPGMDPEAEKRMGLFCDCGIPRTAGPAPIFATSGLGTGEQERYARHGSVVFARHCSGCHGPQGEGNGPAAEVLLPAPRDLKSARYSDRALSEILWAGRPGSAMPPWNDLPARDLRGLVALVQSLESPEEAEAPLTAVEKVKGKDLYERNCQTCHGPAGEGNSVSPTSMAPAPTRFRDVQPGHRRAAQALARGVPGTAMAGWQARLSEAERELLVRYLRSLYRMD